MYADTASTGSAGGPLGEDRPGEHPTSSLHRSRSNDTEEVVTSHLAEAAVLSHDVRTATKDHERHTCPVNWRARAIAAYACFLDIHLPFGRPVMWRVGRAARPVGRQAAAQVRVSDVMRVPVAFASSILCPSFHGLQRPQAAGGHAARRVPCRAIDRGIFWFNPLHGGC
jgi:hypothetical protein